MLQVVRRWLAAATVIGIAIGGRRRLGEEAEHDLGADVERENVEGVDAGAGGEAVDFLQVPLACAGPLEGLGVLAGLESNLVPGHGAFFEKQLAVEGERAGDLDLCC